MEIKRSGDPPALLASEMERFWANGGTAGDALQKQESEVQ